MIRKFFWKAWLRVNPLASAAKSGKEYMAEVSTEGRTLHNSDIARLIVDSGSELEYETLLDVLNHADRLRGEKLREGYSVQTLICRLAPRVLGPWPHATTAFDPATHKITLDIAPTTGMRLLLDEVGVEVLGLRPEVALIGLVTDVTTGLSDGTITSGGAITIEGRRLKVAPSDEAGLGVFLTDGVATYPLKPLAVNYPKKIITLLPPIPPGSYSLYILTRYAGSKTLLNNAQRIDYPGTLHAVAHQ
ncbi:MAG: DUF4469 domain-containing protein [Tannerellaceae bacterium]|jgi:hypothetical protein|nr:DUF4469 domain-containing protein [Tannerellaceae bacterium]